MMLFKICAIAAAVNHNEILRFANRRKHAMPLVAREVNALIAAGQKRFRRSWAITAIMGYNYQPRLAAQRIKGLATKRVTLNQR